jgi:hypothetical protein
MNEHYTKKVLDLQQIVEELERENSQLGQEHLLVLKKQEQMMSGELSSTGASSACFGEIRNNS